MFSAINYGHTHYQECIRGLPVQTVRDDLFTRHEFIA